MAQKNGFHQECFTPKCHIKVIIVGGGTAGLSTASHLSKCGHEVTVLERKSALNIGGGDIQISANAILLLNRLGLLDKMKPMSSMKTDFVVRGLKDMKVLNTIPIAGDAATPARMFWRDDLVRVIYDAAVEAGATILFDKSAVAIDEDGSSVKLQDASVMKGDLIVGADGVKSTIRHLLFPDRETQPAVTNQACFHFTIPYGIMAQCPDLLALYDEGTNLFSIAEGPDRCIVAWALEPRKEYFCITSELEYNEPAGITSWEASAKYADEVRKQFKDWAPTWTKLMNAASEVAKWRIVDGVKGADWVSKSGKVVLVGDAIHTMPPHAAQGCSQGLEDMAALGIFLSALPSPADLPRYLSSLASFRSHRTSKIQQSSRTNLLAMTVPDGPAQEARDEMWRDRMTDDVVVQAWNNMTPNEDADLTDASFLKWVQGYDVVEKVSVDDGQGSGDGSC